MQRLQVAFPQTIPRTTERFIMSTRSARHLEWKTSPVFWVICLTVFAGFASLTARVIAKQRIDDDQLLEAIEAEIRTEPLLASQSVGVKVDEGIVTLKGQVDTMVAKRQAVHLLGNLRGVRSIVDGLIVVSPGGDEQRILRDVRRALRDHSVTEAYEVSADVSSGDVLLEGEVDSYAEREIAEYVVAGVRGVVKIDNQIKVKPRSQRADSEIEADVEARLKLSPLVADSMIATHVDDGVVELSGSVGSYNERQIASMLAWVSGVNEVNVDKLDVVWWLQKERRRDKVTVIRNDAQIREAVEDALLYDPRVKNSKIEVRALNGNVSLIGQVDSLVASRAAEDTAQNTLGVKKVINNLEVELVKWPGDPIVTQRVEAALERDAILSKHPIDASSHFGKVHLHGRVRLPFEKQRAAAVAANVSGVKGINNQIEVSMRDPDKPDVSIREDLQRRLRWSAYLPQNEIEFHVDEGVVTLEGDVETWRQKRAVEAHARQAGARQVINQLKVPKPIIQ